MLIFESGTAFLSHLEAWYTNLGRESIHSLSAHFLCGFIKTYVGVESALELSNRFSDWN